MQRTNDVDGLLALNILKTIDQRAYTIKSTLPQYNSAHSNWTFTDHNRKGFFQTRINIKNSQILTRQSDEKYNYKYKYPPDSLVDMYTLGLAGDERPEMRGHSRYPGPCE